MADKKTHYKLDESGIVGQQENKPESSYKYHFKKTGDVFRQMRDSNSSISNNKKTEKKAS